MQLRSWDALICSDGILESFITQIKSSEPSALSRAAQRTNGSAGAVLFSVLGAVQDFAAPRP